MLQVTQLYIYPVKSLGGICVNTAQVTDRGFKYDRRWVLVDEINNFITQRWFAHLALFQVLLTDKGLLVKYKTTGDEVYVPFTTSGEAIQVKIWDDVCTGVEVNQQVSEWFSRLLLMKCKLVYMPDETERIVDDDYALNNEITSFSDGYPFMIIGQSSLDDLNSRLGKKLPMNRFRPNIVFTGGTPYEEDVFSHFTINEIQFYGVKRCSRCIVTTINQEKAIKGNEPLKTLATYRMVRNKIYFGQNLIHKGEGSISIGDVITIEKRQKR